MVENPYQSPDEAPSKAKKTRPTRWLVRSGMASLVVAACCFVGTVVCMMVSFNRVGQSTSTPTPTDLAESIRWGLILSMPVVPLVILGIGLLVTGFVVRQRSD